MQPFSFPILSLFVMVGAGAGLLAGLFGIGGGIVLIPMFLWAFEAAGFAPEIIVHLAFATSLAVIIPTAISSTAGHRKRGNVDGRQVLRMAVGGVFGVVVGSSLAAGLSGTVLKGLFGLMQIGTGLKMFRRKSYLPPEEPGEQPLSLMVLTGFVVGAFSAFFGVGGGVVAVPMMVILLRQPIHVAIGNSSALMVFSALAGTVSYILHGWGEPALPPFSFGYVNLLVAAVTAPLTILFARLGVRLASRTAHDKMMKGFAGFLILTGFYMMLSMLLG
jgi:uncharacterized membrane protein YfcA